MEIWACEFVTGDRLAVLPASAFNWETILNSAGTVDATIPLRSLPSKTRETVKTYVEAGRMGLAAVTDDGHVMEFGPIWKHRFLDATGDLVVGASGLWSVFDKLKLINGWKIGDRVQDTILSIKDQSLPVIAWNLILLASLRSSFPLAGSQGSDTGEKHERTWPGYELKWIGQALRDLTSVSGGPDIALQPRVRADGLGVEYIARIGSPLLTQVGDPWRWDRGASRGRVQSIDVDVDATGMAQRAWAVGNGMDDQIIIGVAENTAPVDRGYPLFEVETAHTSVTEQSTIDGHALSALAVAERPWSTWTLKVHDKSPNVGLYRPGDWATVVIPRGHDYLPAGEFTTRILSISGNQSHTVTVKLAPNLEAR